MKTLIACAATAFLLGCSQDTTEKNTTINASSRATFGVETAYIIDRYNNVAKKINSRYFLPSIAGFKNGAVNDKFHVLEHQLTNGLSLKLEIDNKTNQPFSISMVGAPTIKEDVLAPILVMGTISAAVFGLNNDESGALMRVCGKDNKSISYQEEFIQNKIVHCTYLKGSWIAGIGEQGSYAP